MLDLVAKIAKNNQLIVLLVTHNPKDAIRIAPHTITVIDGLVSEPLRTSIALDKKSGPLIKYLE